MTRIRSSSESVVSVSVSDQERLSLELGMLSSLLPRADEEMGGGTSLRPLDPLILRGLSGEPVTKLEILSLNSWRALRLLLSLSLDEPRPFSGRGE